MLITHTDEPTPHSDPPRRAFLRTGTLAVLSAGFWLRNEAIALGCNAGRTEAQTQPQKSDFQLTRSKFTLHLSDSFLVRLGGEELDLQLVEVADLKHASVSKSALSRIEDASFKARLYEESFTLRFRSMNEMRLSQGTRKLEHDMLGTIELFLVPVDNASGPWHFYEAVFNRLQN